MEDGLSYGLFILCTDFKNIDKLIIHLEKILTLNIEKNTGFLKIKKIIMGNIDDYNKIILKPSLFIYNRILNYIDCFKDDNTNEFEIMPLEIEHLIIIKIISLSTRIFVTKPDEMNYIASLLEMKKIKVGDKYIDIDVNIHKEEGLLYPAQRLFVPYLKTEF